MRKILVPTDFSDNAFNALTYACQIFKYEKSEIFIVHAYADEVYRKYAEKERSSFEALKEKVHNSTVTKLEGVRKKGIEFSPNPHHTYHLVAAFGDLTDEINDLVQKENMDIVVMGTRGQTNDRSITFGSNTLEVLRYVHCPVLGIPESYTYHAPRKLLFPTNYLVPYKKRELKLLGDLTGSFRSTIYMLYIDPVSTLALRQEDHKLFLKSCLQKSKLVFETSDEKDKTVAITKFIIHQKIDMLVMVNSRYSHLEEMLHQHTIRKIGLHVKIPFLILQNINR
ncbi:universal stress protein [Arenibacter sp. GZD96]|uniref:universal stress protein n=1 Tax=Aurantibrevibacter litoralis TaxID=3106030 RepID=UPI002B001807|nr:universal stress protein [Arenibacter sp. GZD-96]MEA1785188.1 universal stress protein [Arenibacter sp. GZD-96]